MKRLDDGGPSLRCAATTKRFILHLFSPDDPTKVGATDFARLRNAPYFLFRRTLMGFNRRRSGLTTACGLLALGGLASAAAPAWSAEDAAGKTVSIDVAAGDLHAVVSMLERQVNVEASVRDGDKPFKPVYVHLDGASLPKALRTIAQSAGAKVTKNEDGVYVFEPESAPADGGGASSPPLSSPPLSSPPTAGPNRVSRPVP